MQPSSDIRRLIDIMATLRNPIRGCPWDVQQTFASIAPFTIEEAYEVADAIERGATEDLREELGDLLLQVVFHARIAEEAGLFDFGGVVEAITTKLVRRHPHVFGDAGALNSDEVNALWGSIKAEEKRAKRALDPKDGPEEAKSGTLDGVPLATAGAFTRPETSRESRESRF
jgi:nucleoside triphosphate diphosphatase